MSETLDDIEIRAVFCWVLDTDPGCPLTPNARRYGSADPATAWLMTGYLLATIRKTRGTWGEKEKAHRVVTRELEARLVAHLGEPSHADDS